MTEKVGTKGACGQWLAMGIKSMLLENNSMERNRGRLECRKKYWSVTSMYNYTKLYITYMLLLSNSTLERHIKCLISLLVYIFNT